MVIRQIAKHTAANISQCTTRFPLGRYPGQFCKSRHRQSGRTNNSRPCVGDVMTPPQILHLANGYLKNIGMLCTDAYGGSTAYANQRMKPGDLVIGQNVDQHADQMDWQCKTHSHYFDYEGALCLWTSSDTYVCFILFALQFGVCNAQQRSLSSIIWRKLMHS